MAQVFSLMLLSNPNQLQLASAEMQRDVALAIRQLIVSGIPAYLLSPLVDTQEVCRVSIDRVHLSAKRPPNFQLRVHSAVGPEQLLLAEYLGASAESHARSEQASLRKSRRGQLHRADAIGIMAQPALGLVIRRPGLDVRLPGLRLMHHRHEAAALVSQLKGSTAESRSVTLMSHRLGKRAVLRIELATGEAHYARSGIGHNDAAGIAFSKHQLLHQRLKHQNQLALPTPIGFDVRLGVAVYDTLPGQPLNLRAKDAASSCHGIAHALDALQSLKDLRLPVHTEGDEAMLLHQFFARTVSIFPEIAQRLSDPLERVVSQLNAGNTSDYVVCHRDLHPLQVYISEDAVGILDFDTVCLSSPALDIGNLAAHIFLASVRGECRSAELEAELIDASNSVSERQFQLWRSSALLRLTMLYSLTAEPPSIVTALIDEVCECCYR